MKKKTNHIKIYKDLFILYGQSLTLKSHANHCIKIILCEEEITVVHDRKQYRSHGLILKSDLTHHVKANDHIGITIFLDPETDIGHFLNMLLRKNRVIKLDNTLAAKLFEFFTDVVENHTTESEIVDRLQHTLSQSTTVYRTLDPRIEQIISHINHGQSDTVQFTELLNLSSLSPSRLIHLFKKEIGIPIRRYILWCKTKKALAAIASGTTIKKAAIIGGFTDAAHFNRSFLSMFGNSPSNLLK